MKHRHASKGLAWAQKACRKRIGAEQLSTLYIATPYLAGAFLIAALGFGGHWLTKKVYNRESAQVVAGQIKAPEIDLQAPDAATRLLSSYLELSGGAQSWIGLESIAASGIIFHGSDHHSFSLSKSKDGTRSLYITNRATETQITTINGTTARYPQPEPNAPAEDHIESIAHLSKEFYNPMIEAAFTETTAIVAIKEQTWQNIPVIAITVQRTDCSSELFLYKEDLSLLLRTDHLSDGSFIKYRFSSYQMIHGIRLPMMIRAESANGSVSNIRYTEIRPSIHHDTRLAIERLDKPKTIYSIALTERH